jgi:hypothetical protein
MNKTPLAKKVLWAVISLVISGTFISCQKSDKQSTAGGGSSTQSVLSVRGAAR